MSVAISSQNSQVSSSQYIAEEQNAPNLLGKRKLVDILLETQNPENEIWGPPLPAAVHQKKTFQEFFSSDFLISHLPVVHFLDIPLSPMPFEAELGFPLKIHSTMSKQGIFNFSDSDWERICIVAQKIIYPKRKHNNSRAIFNAAFSYRFASNPWDIVATHFKINANTLREHYIKILEAGMFHAIIFHYLPHLQTLLLEDELLKLPKEFTLPQDWKPTNEEKKAIEMGFRGYAEFAKQVAARKQNPNPSGTDSSDLPQ